MSAAPLLAVFAVAFIAARALFLWLRAVVRSVMRKARLFAWGAVFGAVAAASASAHLPAVLLLAAVTMLAAAAAVRMLARSGTAWRTA